MWTRMPLKLPAKRNLNLRNNMKTRIWNCTEVWPDKVNFIDANNVILGYDLEQSCYERAFWTVSQSADGSDVLHHGDESKSFEVEIDGYVFDPSFRERLENEDEGGYVEIFKLVPFWRHERDKPDLYIRLENHHNGYYGHGFTFSGSPAIDSYL